MQRQRIDALTGIRAVAATMVFLYHKRKYWNAHLPVPVLRFLNEFHTGVSVFFVLSGFLIAYTYKDQPMQSARKYGHYVLTRCIRIFPVFLLVLIAKNSYVGFPHLKEGILCYTLLNGFSNYYNLDGIPQAWSLNVELCFYLLAPFIYFLVKRNILKAVLFHLLLLILAFGIGYGWHAFNGNKSGVFYPAFFIFNGTYAGRFFEFFSGLLLGYYFTLDAPVFHRLKHKTLAGGLLMLVLIYGLSFFEVNLYKVGTEQPGGLILRNLVLPVAVCLLIAGLITENTWLRKVLQTKLLVLLGNASFVFYLIHSGFLSELIHKKNFFPQFSFVLLWALSILIYRAIEKPLYRFLKKKLSPVTEKV